MPQVSIQAVMIWITICHDSLRYLRVNHYRFFVGGIDVRTTSFGKVLHWSMKNGVDGERPNMSLYIVFGLMMTKNERKGKNTAKENANKMNAIRLWSILDMNFFLVPWYGIEAHKEWN